MLILVYIYDRIPTSTTNSIFPNIPQYVPSLYKSTTHFSASFSFDAPKIWNDLPADIRSAPSLMLFKSTGIYFWKVLSSLAIFISHWFSLVQTFLCPWFVVLGKVYHSKRFWVCFAEIKRNKVNFELKFRIMLGHVNQVTTSRCFLISATAGWTQFINNLFSFFLASHS